MAHRVSGSRSRSSPPRPVSLLSSFFSLSLSCFSRDPHASPFSGLEASAQLGRSSRSLLAPAIIPQTQCNLTLPVFPAFRVCTANETDNERTITNKRCPSACPATRLPHYPSSGGRETAVKPNGAARGGERRKSNAHGAFRLARPLRGYRFVVTTSTVFLDFSFPTFFFLVYCSTDEDTLDFFCQIISLQCVR